MFQILLAIIYLTFISLGLPDALLGAAWPQMHVDVHADIAYAGIVSTIICAGTIVSALLSDRMSRRIGAGKLTAFSVGLTAVSLVAFGFASSFWQVLLLAIPYGLGAGGVDAALNNYVAIHYESRHMSWLHCMWGVGASVGPYIISAAMFYQTWRSGYLWIGIIQCVITACIFLSLPLWKRNADSDSNQFVESKPLTYAQIIRIPGAMAIFIMFFCYCAIESTVGLWATSYMVEVLSISKDTAASLASLFYIGITVGRAISGFLTMRFADSTMIRIGQILLLIGVITIIIPSNNMLTLIAIVCVGLGCAPIYPCVIHSTPVYFGADKSQAIVGIQMACAYAGSMVIPALFGFIVGNGLIGLWPVYVLAILVLMICMHELLRYQVTHQKAVKTA
ncbi:MAG: MFS transporter [Bifidobacteriaceae bacterium]|nr:MFS transporter [Bifidobacteriaceae bacterium]